MIYREAVKMRLYAEQNGDPIAFEKAAAMFDYLDMRLAAQRCLQRAAYYKWFDAESNPVAISIDTTIDIGELVK